MTKQSRKRRLSEEEDEYAGSSPKVGSNLSPPSSPAHPSPQKISHARELSEAEKQELSVRCTPQSTEISMPRYPVQGDTQFAGFRSAAGSAVNVKTETLRHVHHFHDTWDRVADDMLKDLIDPNKPI